MIRKILVAVMLVAVALGASAEYRWGVTAGTNISDYKFKQDLVDVSPSVGFQAGIMGELMFPGVGFGVDWGVSYSMHGAKVDLGKQVVWSSDGYGNEQIWMHSIQIPIHLRFKYTNLNGIERIVAPFVYAGPRFSFTVADNGCKAMQFPAGSVQIQFGLGAELWEHLQVFGNYNLGVSYEMRTVKLQNFSARPSSWNIGLAYFF